MVFCGCSGMRLLLPSWDHGGGGVMGVMGVGVGGDGEGGEGGEHVRG